MERTGPRSQSIALRWLYEGADPYGTFMSRLLFIALLLLPALALAEPPTDAPRLRFAGGEFRPVSGAAERPDWYRAARVKRSARGSRYLVAVTRG
ncbi:MAG: hypothetical protein OEQ13_11250, partial [Acidobacteriota bacterium]|nr:hypothetical protein [Acidobacteriota bacterium]